MRLFFAVICLAAVAFAQNSTPAITSVTPGAIDAGGPDVTLTVTVSAFVSGAVVKWSGTPLETTYVNDNTLSARVPTNLIAICGKYLLTVNAQSTDSNSFPIIVKPVLKALSPNNLPAGSGGATVTATGLGFSSNVSLILVASGSQRNIPTTYGGPTALSGFVPASDLNGIYPVSLFVTDPTTGAESQKLPMTLTVASVGAILPTNIQAGIIACTLPSPSCFTLQVFGANFVPGVQVLWNGTPLATSYIDGNRVTAIVPAPLVHDPGDIGIQVKNPGTAASNSIKLVVGADPYGTTIFSLSPSSVLAGGPSFTLTVTGERFAQASTVLWVRTPLKTTFVSSSQLTATVPVELLATEGVSQISVSNPGSSNSVSFPILAATPSISSISPTSAVAGGPAFTLTVNGSGFIPASIVTGLPGAPTTYVSRSQLTVSVPAAAIASAGTFPIQVVNPGQVISTEAPIFTVKAPTPTPAITALNPPSALAGAPDFTLTVNGSNFLSNATVAWNGAPLATKFVSAGQLTALVPAALIATAGTARVTVTGEGGTSNTLTFTIALAGPATSSAGILNAASSLPAIAPGTLIAIFGSNLATSTAQFSAAPLPLSLGTTSLSINGTPAPLLYVSPGQVNAQVPYETKVGTAKLVVTSNGVPSPAVNFEVSATGPGVFTQDNKHLLALNLADGQLNGSQTPARPGQYVTAYLTGQGLLDPPVTTGNVAPASPFSIPVGVVQIKIGGRLADVQFAGMAPGFVGLMQMNVLIPDVPPGEQSFDVSIGDVAAATTTISIGPKQ